jgi:polyisoprenoid-binding protein YceI
MKTRLTVTSIAVLAVAAAALLTGTRSHAQSRPSAVAYKLDAAHCAVVFRIAHLGMSHTYGRFNDVSGKLMTDPAGHGSTSFEAVIKAASIDTNNKKRDDHLRSPDFFNVNQFPTITFKSGNVHAHGDVLHVTGELTLLGTTRPVEFHLRKMGEGKDPWGNQRIGFTTDPGRHMVIKRSDFGMTGHDKMVGNEVELMISFEGIRQ